MCHCHSYSVALNPLCLLNDTQKNRKPVLLNHWIVLIRDSCENILKSDPQKYPYLYTVAWCDLPSVGPRILVDLTQLDIS